MRLKVDGSRKGEIPLRVSGEVGRRCFICPFPAPSCRPFNQPPSARQPRAASPFSLPGKSGGAACRAACCCHKLTQRCLKTRHLHPISKGKGRRLSRALERRFGSPCYIKQVQLPRSLLLLTPPAELTKALNSCTGELQRTRQTPLPNLLLW